MFRKFGKMGSNSSNATSEQLNHDNLLLDSGITIENSNYNIANYAIAHPELLEQGVKVTCTIWGELNEKKSRWMFYNTNVTTDIAGATKDEFTYYPKKKMWTIKTTWNNNSNVYGETIIPESVKIYVAPSSVYNAISKIERVKLELGWNNNPVWTPAPED